MGHVETELILANPDIPDKVTKVIGLVDTGATFTVIPRKLFQDLRLTTTGRRVEVETAKGSLELEETYIRLSSDGINVLTPTLVSDQIGSVLVGVITLEQLSFKVNPITGKLERHPALLF